MAINFQAGVRWHLYLTYKTKLRNSSILLEFLFFLHIEAVLFEFCVRVFFLKIPLGDKGLHRRARTMRMVKIQRKQLTLEEAVQKFLRWTNAATCFIKDYLYARHAFATLAIGFIL